MVDYGGPERREFIRLEYSKPLAYKVCKPEILSKLFEGYSVNVSEAGILCNIKEKVKVDDVLWLSFDKSVLIICEQVERRSFIYQNGIIGKAVRVQNNENGTFDIGVKFIMREEREHLLPAIKNSL